MPPSDEQKRERERTDESLETERKKTDDEIVRRGSAAETDADAVLRLVRERADRVLEAARRREDGRSGSDPASDEARTALKRERERADATVERDAPRPKPCSKTNARRTAVRWSDSSLMREVGPTRRCTPSAPSRTTPSPRVKTSSPS
jgi:hypothetical protein